MYKQQGFTLVEVITVMLVLVAIASVTVESSKDFVFQNRYDITKDRYEKIKKAIIGDTNQVINGQPNIEGFVKDVGRLPFNLHELTDGYCSANTTANFYSDATSCATASGQWHSKMYLAATDAKDGWGNTGTDNNYGWNVISSSSDLTIQSKGKNSCLTGEINCTDSDSYDEDYPQATALPSIKQNDWMVNLDGIQANVIASGFKGTCSIAASLCPSVGGTWFTSQPTDATNCGTLGGTWDGTGLTCSGVSLPVCSVSIAKSLCESSAGIWTYQTSTVCMKITDNRSASSIIPSNTLFQTIQEDGREHLITFPFFNDSITANGIQETGEDDITTPLGAMSIGIYKNCDTTPTHYGNTQQDIQMTLYPNSTLPTINW